MTAFEQPSPTSTAAATATTSPGHPDLAALLQRPYRPGDAAYAAALWHATVQRLASLPTPPACR
jgi:hypothetical protein